MIFVGDYIHLYQQQREQLQKRYQEKDEIIQQLTAERENLQVRFLVDLFCESLEFFRGKSRNYLWKIRRSITVRDE